MTTDLLFRDLYHGNGPVNVTAYANDPNCAGLILKCFQGLSYDTTWFDEFWPQVVKAQSDGKFVAVGAYDWLIFASSGTEQWADYARVMARHGGWMPGVLPPIADVERGSNPGATAASIEKCCKAWNAAAANDGNDTRLLYGRALLNDLHVTDHMGFTDLWTPRYPAGSPPWVTWRTWLGSPPVSGWTLADVRLVQESNGTTGAVTHTLGGQSLDTSLWTGTLAELHTFAGQYAPPPPPPPPPGGPMNDADAKQLGYSALKDWRVQEQRNKAIADVLLGIPKRTGQDAAYNEAYDKAEAKLP